MTPCQLLDDYLARDLTGAELARFSDHLGDCPDCRQAVGEHRRLEALLTASADLEPVPAWLAERIRRRVRAGRRRRVAAVAAVAAAVTGACLLIRPTAPPPAAPVPAVAISPSPPAPDEPKPPARPRVRFPTDVLAVPVPSESANVTVIRVYPGRRSIPPAPERSDDE